MFFKFWLLLAILVLGVIQPAVAADCDGSPWLPQDRIEEVFGPSNPFEKQHLAGGCKTMAEFEAELTKWGYPHEYEEVFSLVCTDGSSYRDYFEHKREEGKVFKRVLLIHTKNKMLLGAYLIPNAGSMTLMPLRFLRTDDLMRPVQSRQMDSALSGDESMIAKAIRGETVPTCEKNQKF